MLEGEGNSPIISRHSGRPFVIRDPVHGYLATAFHERDLVDHPVTQRLRRITQTGLAEYVFPEARTSRFVHSLGAMHVASRFVLAALENAEEETANHFFDRIDSLVGRFSGERDNYLDLLKQDGTLSALSTVRASFRHEKLRSKRTQQLMAVVEAGLRLAALFHDLGHLPFSHDVEYALQDFAARSRTTGTPLDKQLAVIAEEEAPHEEIGHRLAVLAFHALGPETSASVKAAFNMATNILNEKAPQYSLRKKPQATALQWLHSLIDGEIDADRADYLLRDGQALGLDFAHYDIDRLVSNLVLIEDNDLGFVTAVKERGLPALESYCLSRSRSNQVFIRHHKVAQAASALRHASVRAFGHDAARPLLEVLTELGAEIDGPRDNVLRKFAFFDDSWWVQVLRTVQRDINDSFTESCLGLVLDRQRTLRSVWKRKGDLTDDQIEKINTKVDDLFASGGQIRLADTRKKLLDKGILINAFKFKPYTRRESTNESVMLISGKRGAKAASKASPLIRGLQDIWKEDIHLYAFVRENENMPLEEVIDAIVNG